MVNVFLEEEGGEKVRAGMGDGDSKGEELVSR